MISRCWSTIWKSVEWPFSFWIPWPDVTDRCHPDVITDESKISRFKICVVNVCTYTTQILHREILFFIFNYFILWIVLRRITFIFYLLQFFMQVGKEMLNPANKGKDGEGPSFNLLMELLRGDHWPKTHPSRWKYPAPTFKVKGVHETYCSRVKLKF